MNFFIIKIDQYEKDPFICTYPGGNDRGDDGPGA
jgi:hypothetical protein